MVSAGDGVILLLVDSDLGWRFVSAVDDVGRVS